MPSLASERVHLVSLSLPNTRSRSAGTANAGSLSSGAGGNAGGSASSELWLLDLETDTWKLLPAGGQSPPGRTGHDMVWLAGQNAALSFGGGSAELWQVMFN